eukprot:TRINITY_DN82718_c0_g1_i1.p1 TRINITY_DN82718_c0_g1~~TRINITY_DN82718_c0_g1_i1.p1  ORF type:complete len:1291 (+),score=150.61 TRINITY_DN82718_c0_g1_i1:131-4003(+)
MDATPRQAVPFFEEFRSAILQLRVLPCDDAGRFLSTTEAIELFPSLRRSALKWFKVESDAPGLQFAKDDAAFVWAYLSWLATHPSARKLSQQILELTHATTKSQLWNEVFWELPIDDQLPVWTLMVTTKERSVEMSQEIAVQLLQYSCAKSGVAPAAAMKVAGVETWLAPAPPDFVAAVLQKLADDDDAGHVPPVLEERAVADPVKAKQQPGSIRAVSGSVPARASPGDRRPTLHPPVGDPPPPPAADSPTRATSMQSVCSNPMRRDDATGREEPVEPGADSRAKLMQEDLGQVQPVLLEEKQKEQEPRKPVPPLDLLRTSAASAVRGDESPRSDEMSPTRRRTEIACDFDGSQPGLHTPGAGPALSVRTGDKVQVIGFHPAGWACVQNTENQTGWVPDEVLRAPDEIGRGIAIASTRDSTVHVATKEPMLGVAEGATLKLLDRRGEHWFAEANGVRGLVPVSAVRELSGEETADAAKKHMAEATMTIGGLAAETTRESKKSSAASASTAAGEKTKPQWTFGLWSYLASFYSVATCLMCGITGMIWSFREENRYPGDLKQYPRSNSHFIISVYCAFGSLAWLAALTFLQRSWKREESQNFALALVRCLIYLAAAVPLFCTLTTVLAGITVVFCGLLRLISLIRGEHGEAPSNARLFKAAGWLRADEEGDLKKVSKLNPKFWLVWWQVQGLRGERGKWYIIMLWLVANIYLGLAKYFQTREMLLNPEPELVQKLMTECFTGDMDDGNCLVLLDKYQFWIPIAKLFGNQLNLNCGLIVLVVCQHFLKRINERAVKDRSILGDICRLLPVHKYLIGHKRLASAIAIQAFAHTFAHYMAHTYTLPTFIRFGFSGTPVAFSIWATGALILLCICVMYPVSREYVRHSRFEMFYYTHAICGTTFMVALLYHAPVFYIFAAFPLGLYVLDVYSRSQVVGLTGARLLEMRWRPPVMQLKFAKPFNYISGQYIKLRCPSLSPYEDHPFTIASAPETDRLCLAIKCWPGGWTERLRNLLVSVVETSSRTTADFSHEFGETNWLTGEVRPGISALPDGTPLLQIDGPLCAPAMHYLEYEVAILAGAGVGLTPAASILQSLLAHRWRKDEAAWPRALYFAWLCPASDVSAYKWFCDEVADAEVAIAAHGDATGPAGRYCELHLFVTRAPKPDAAGAQKPPNKGKTVKTYKPNGSVHKSVRKPYTGAELEKWMLHPATGTDEMASCLSQPQSKRNNAAGNSQVWNGRPDWDALFEHVVADQNARCSQVGVFFCGAPMIGKELKKMCLRHTSREMRFDLLKENF